MISFRGYDLQIGDTVTVLANFGNGPLLTVVIDGVGEKNGRPLIDYADPDGTGFRWAYLSQVTSVVRRVGE